MRYVATLLLIVAQAAVPLTGSLQWCLRADGSRHLEGGPLAHVSLVYSSASARPMSDSSEVLWYVRCAETLDAGNDPAPCEGAHVRIFPPQPTADRHGPPGLQPVLAQAEATALIVEQANLAVPSLREQATSFYRWDCTSTPLRC